MFRAHIALPQQHGSWALWLGPYAVGIGVGGRWDPALFWLTLASLGAFLAMQPLTLLVKIAAGRRSRADLRPASFWLGCWMLLAAIGAAGLAASGHWRVLLLGLPALPVLAWQMWLVAGRSERGQMGIELVAAGVLTLAAAAGYQVTAGYTRTAWWLWGLCWLQSAGSIVYIYLRLEHRRMTRLPEWPERLRMAKDGLLFNAANLLLVAFLAGFGSVPWLAALPFGLMLLEFLHGGLLKPAVRVKPAKIGVRQILVTIIFSFSLILAYRM